MLKDIISPRDFRDPKLFEQDGWYYCLAGIRVIDPETYNDRLRAFNSYQSKEEMVFYRDIRNLNPSRGLNPDSSPSVMAVLGGDENAIGLGHLTLFRTKDLKNWEFCGVLLQPQEDLDDAFFNLKGVYECPDYFVSNGKEIILASPQNLPQIGSRFQNLHSVIYLTGQMDFEKGHFHIDLIEDLDSGFDIYASQTLQHPDGRRIMIAWKEMWDRSYPTEEDQWVGSYTLPRELVYQDGRLCQIPVREIEAFRANPREIRNQLLDGGPVRPEGFSGDVAELEVTFTMKDAPMAGVKVFKGTEHETVIYYHRKKESVFFDRTFSGLPITGKEPDINVRVCHVGDLDEITFRIFLDKSSVEVFIDGGRYVMTGNVYPDPGDLDIEFFSAGQAEISRAVMYDIVV